MVFHILPNFFWLSEKHWSTASYFISKQKHHLEWNKILITVGSLRISCIFILFMWLIAGLETRCFQYLSYIRFNGDDDGVTVGISQSSVQETEATPKSLNRKGCPSSL